MAPGKGQVRRPGRVLEDRLLPSPSIIFVTTDWVRARALPLRWAQLDRIASVPPLVMAFAGFVLLGMHLLPGRNFWWDEAGQYWMAQGQYHLSPTGTGVQPLSTGIEFGRNGYNLDPLGFTAVLRMWIDVWGDTPMALRALPFLFYLLCYFVAVAFGRWLRVPWVLSLTVPFVVLATPLPTQFAVELRAFSVEMLAVLITGGLVTATIHLRRWPLCMMLACVLLTAGVASRYSYSCAIGAAVGASIFLALVRRDWLLVRMAVLLLGSAVVTLVLLVWNIGIFGGGVQSSPSYTDHLELAGSWKPQFLASTVQVNLLSGVHVLTGAFIAVGGFVVASQMVKGQFKQLSAAAWFPLYVFVVLYEMAAATVSALGLAPWNADWRWSIGLNSIAILSGLGLASLCVEWLRDRSRTPEGGLSLGVAGGLVAVCWLAVAVSLLRIVGFERIEYQPIDEAVTQVSARSGTSGVTWLVAVDQWPTFRMLSETGARGDLPVPETARMLGTAAAGGVPPVFATSDSTLAADLPSQFPCRGSATTAVLIPQSPTEAPLTERAIRDLAAEKGCGVDVMNLGTGGTVLLIGAPGQVGATKDS